MEKMSGEFAAGRSDPKMDTANLSPESEEEGILLPEGSNAQDPLAVGHDDEDIDESVMPPFPPSIVIPLRCAPDPKDFQKLICELEINLPFPAGNSNGRSGEKEGPRPQFEMDPEWSFGLMKTLEGSSGDDPKGDANGRGEHGLVGASGGGPPQNGPPVTLETEALAGLEEKVLKIGKQRVHPSHKAVPDSEKDEKYYAKREKNTLAARKSRQEKRALDEYRVQLIKDLTSQIVNIKKEIEALTREREVYREVLTRNMAYQPPPQKRGK